MANTYLEPSDLSAYVPNTGNTTIGGIKTFPSAPILVAGFVVGATLVNTSGAELNHVVGVTSGIQAQLNTKSPLISPNFTTPNIGVASGTSLALAGNLSAGAGTFSGAVSFATGPWNISAEGVQRFAFVGNSTSYWKGAGSVPHIWRSNADVDLMTLGSSGDLVTIGNLFTSAGTFTGNLSASAGTFTSLAVTKATAGDIASFGANSVAGLFKIQYAETIAGAVELVGSVYGPFALRSLSDNHILVLPHGTGNFGVNTPNPTEKLHVVGNILASGNLSAAAGTFSGAVNLAGITKAALLALTPTATTGGRWRVTDASPAQRSAYPDGTNWRYTSDDAIVV